MKKLQLISCIIALVAFGLTTVQADNLPEKVHIKLTESQSVQGDLQVSIVLPAEGFESFDGLFSNLVFTMKWPANKGITLGDVKQKMEDKGTQHGSFTAASQYVPIDKAGDVATFNGYNYQKFGSVSLTKLADVNSFFPGKNIWNPGDEVVIMTITPNNGTFSDFEIIVDEWTNANNGDFYVELNGYNKTGKITAQMRTPEDGAAVNGVNIYPNPAIDHIQIEINEYLMEKDLNLSILDQGGKVLLEANANNLVTKVELTDFAAGVYNIKFTDNEGEVVKVQSFSVVK